MIYRTLNFADKLAYQTMRFSDQYRLLAIPANIIEIVLKCFLEIANFFSANLHRSCRFIAFLKAKTFTQCFSLMNPFRKATTLSDLQKQIDIKTREYLLSSFDDVTTSSDPSNMKSVQNTPISSNTQKKKNSTFNEAYSEIKSLYSDNASPDTDTLMKILSKSKLTHFIHQSPRLINEIDDNLKMNESFNICLILSDLTLFNKLDPEPGEAILNYLDSDIKTPEFLDEIWNEILKMKPLQCYKFLENLLRCDFKLFSTFLGNHPKSITIQKIRTREQNNNSGIINTYSKEMDKIITSFVSINPDFLFLLDEKILIDSANFILELYKNIPKLKNDKLFFKKLHTYLLEIVKKIPIMNRLYSCTVETERVKELICNILKIEASLYSLVDNTLKSDKEFNFFFLKNFPEKWDSLPTSVTTDYSFAINALCKVSSFEKNQKAWTPNYIFKCLTYLRTQKGKEYQNFFHKMFKFQAANFLKALSFFIKQNKLGTLNQYQTEQCIKKNETFLAYVCKDHDKYEANLSDSNFQALYYYVEDGYYFKSDDIHLDEKDPNIYDSLRPDLKINKNFNFEIIAKWPELWTKIHQTLHSVDFAIHTLLHFNPYRNNDLIKKIFDDLSLKFKKDLSTLMRDLLEKMIQDNSTSQLMSVCKKFLMLAQSPKQKHVDIFICFLETSCSLCADLLNEETYKEWNDSTFYKFFFPENRKEQSHWNERFEDDTQAEIKDLARLVYGLTKTSDWIFRLSPRGINNLIAHKNFDASILKKETFACSIKDSVITYFDNLYRLDLVDKEALDLVDKEALDLVGQEYISNLKNVEKLDFGLYQQLSNRLGCFSCLLDAEVVYKYMSFPQKIKGVKEHLPSLYFITLGLCHERNSTPNEESDKFKIQLEEFEKMRENQELMKSLVKGDLRCFQFVLEKHIKGQEETWKSIIGQSKDPQNFKKIILTMLLINKRKGLKLNKLTMNHIFSWLQEDRLLQFFFKHTKLLN